MPRKKDRGLRPCEAGCGRLTATAYCGVCAPPDPARPLAPRNEYRNGEKAPVGKSFRQSRPKR